MSTGTIAPWGVVARGLRRLALPAQAGAAALAPRRTIRSWIGRTAAVAVMAATAAVGHAAVVNAAERAPDSVPSPGAVSVYYELRNNHTDKCADVENASRGWNSVVHQWTCHRQPHQLWSIDPISTSGNIQLRNKNSQLCLAAGFPYYEGEVVRQLDCTLDDGSGLGNVWTPVWDGGSYKLVHYYSALAGWNPPLCLDLDRGSRSDGAKIQLLRCASDSNAQNWYFA